MNCVLLISAEIFFGLKYMHPNFFSNQYLIGVNRVLHGIFIFSYYNNTEHQKNGFLGGAQEVN